MTEFRLYLGKNRRGPDGINRPIPAEELNEFYTSPVLLHLEGYTITPSLGCWRGDTEGSDVLVCLGEADRREEIRKVGKAYQAMFQQEAVYMTASTVDLDVIE